MTVVRRYAPALGALVALLACAVSVSAQSSLRSAGITATVMPLDKGSERFAPAAAWLTASGMLDAIAAIMNETVRWTRPIALIADECGRPTAVYRANAEGAAVILCYELVDAIVERFRRDDLSRQDRSSAQTGAVAFILFHEIGHALIDQFQLPLTGSAESAANEFAAIALGNGQPMAAFWAARYLRTDSARHDTAPSDRRAAAGFAADHGLDADRLDDILCWTFGADPSAALRMLRSGAVAVARATQCEREYSRLSNTWELLLAPHTRAGAAAAHIGQ